MDTGYTDNDHIVRVYRIERTLCDIVHGNSKVSKEEVVNAYMHYSKRKNIDVNVLFKFARLLKVEDKGSGYTEVLI